MDNVSKSILDTAEGREMSDIKPLRTSTVMHGDSHSLPAQDESDKISAGAAYAMKNEGKNWSPKKDHNDSPEYDGQGVGSGAASMMSGPLDTTIPLPAGHGFGGAVLA